MRIFILVLVTILFSSNINSQTIGKVVYKSILKKNSNKPIIEELLFSKDKSLYRLIKKEKPPVSSFDESENKIVFNPHSLIGFDLVGADFVILIYREKVQR